MINWIWRSTFKMILQCENSGRMNRLTISDVHYVLYTVYNGRLKANCHFIFGMGVWLVISQFKCKCSSIWFELDAIVCHNPPSSLINDQLICLFSFSFPFPLAWVLGRMVCKAVPYLQGVSVNASVYTLVAISIDR